MKTKLLSFNSDECLEIINNHDVLAFPTETVFGFGIRYDSEMAFNKLCSLKKRRPDKPFTIMLSQKQDIGKFVDLNQKMNNLVEKFMPGEITIIFPDKNNLYSWLTLNQGHVGIRIPDDNNVRQLIDRVGKPLLVTSANISDQSPLLNSEDVYQQFNNQIRGIVKGDCKSNVPSTIILIDNDKIKLIRQGNISFDEIQKEWEK